MPASQQIAALETSACQADGLFPDIQNGEVHESGEGARSRRIEKI
ncbi:hypothetical protein SynSYN20_02252 [Synechococcus sp. SYN20]|nr:hypothetical protein SynSYN20_02252 [Synechococcus sp. SYN20]